MLKRYSLIYCLGDYVKTNLAVVLGLVLIFAVAPVEAENTGDNQAEFIVYCNIDGAEVYFDDIYKGFIGDGELKVPIYTTDKPYSTYLVKKDGYTPFTTKISNYPAAGGTVKLYSTLTPSGTQYAKVPSPGSPITILTGIALGFLGFAYLLKRE